MMDLFYLAVFVLLMGSSLWMIHAFDRVSR
jgi:hypothetical protein